MISTLPRLKRYWRWFGLLYALCWHLAAAQPEVVTVPALRDVAVYEDAQGEETIERIAAAPERFRPLRGDGLSAGYSRSVYWLRFSIDAPAGEWWLDFLPPFLDDLRLYETSPAYPGLFVERRAGDWLAFDRREVAYRGFVFKVSKGDASPKTVYLRLQTTSSVMLIPRLWSPEAFHSDILVEYGLLLGVIGVLVVMLLVNLVNWFWLGDAIYPWFLAYLGILVLIFVLSGGFFAQYFAPLSPVLGDVLMNETTLMGVALAMPFQRRLFLVESSQKFLFNLYQIAFWVPIIGLAAMIIGYYKEAAHVTLNIALVMNFVGFWLSFRLWRRGSPGGGLLLAANLIGQVGILAIVSNLLGLWYSPTAAIFGLQISLLGSLVAMQMAIGARLGAMRDNQRLAEEKARSAETVARSEREIRRQQTEFFAMLSHELKTPLAMIDGSVQSLDLLVQQEPDVQRRHERIRRAVDRINDLVQKFLYQSHVEGENPPMQHDPVQLDRLIRKIVNGFAIEPGRIELDLTGEVWTEGDETLIKVMVTNLVDNALKYSLSGTVVRVALRRNDPSAIAVIEVRDAGRGVAPELRDRLFERYVRGGNLGDIPGTGLGLYLVASIARLHGGKAELLDTGTSTGATFSVSLPLTERAS